MAVVAEESSEGGIPPSAYILKTVLVFNRRMNVAKMLLSKT